jgi:CRP-like cAMP-binding protein
MLVDLTGSFPWETLATSLSTSWQWLRIFKLINCLRFKQLGFRAQEAPQTAEYTSAHETAHRIRRLMQVGFTFGFVLHLLICTYWAVVAYEWDREQWSADSKSTADSFTSPSFTKWLPPEEKWSVDATFVEQYVFAGHNVLLCAIGNDLQPHTVIEGVFSSFLMLSGVVMVAGVIGSMTQILSRADLLENEKNDKIDSVMTFLRGRGVPLPLQDKICAYLRYIWDTGQSQYHQSLVDELPYLLSLQLKIALKQNLIEVLPMFESCTLSATLAIIHILRQRIALPDEVVVRQGESGDRMFFVSRGTLAVFQKVNGTDSHVTEIHAGGYFGELALFGSCMRNATIIAETFAELEELLIKDFKVLIGDHKDLEEYFRMDSRNRYGNMGKQTESTKTTKNWQRLRKSVRPSLARGLTFAEPEEDALGDESRSSGPTMMPVEALDSSPASSAPLSASLSEDTPSKSRISLKAVAIVVKKATETAISARRASQDSGMGRRTSAQECVTGARRRSNASSGMVAERRRSNASSGMVAELLALQNQQSSKDLSLDETDEKRTSFSGEAPYTALVVGQLVWSVNLAFVDGTRLRHAPLPANGPTDFNGIFVVNDEKLVVQEVMALAGKLDPSADFVRIGRIPQPGASGWIRRTNLVTKPRVCGLPLGSATDIPGPLDQVGAGVAAAVTTGGTPGQTQRSPATFVASAQRLDVLQASRTA